MSFTLQPYTSPSSRYHCPQCNHRSKSFVRYIDTETNEHLADHVGRCSREDKCGYHYKPRQYFSDNPGKSNNGTWQPGKGFYPHSKPNAYAKRHTAPTPAEKPEGWQIHPDVVNASFTRYEQNNLVQYLINRFGRQLTSHMIGRYRIGTSKHWPGATIFWQLDGNGCVRTGKIMLYNAQTGKRVKQPFNHIAWAHVLMRNAKCGLRNDYKKNTSAIGIPHSDFILRQCLFGEHLLTEEPHKPVAIVESEKTAIIAAIHSPERIWLATGSVGNLNADICQSLRNRHVTLYPDLGAYEKWQKKARELQPFVKGSRFVVSDILERIAGAYERSEGLDLGDCL